MAEELTLPRWLEASEILDRAASGEGGFVAWTIDASYPADDPEDHPRIGCLRIWYTLENGEWCRLNPKSPKIAEIRARLDAGALGSQMRQWATAYDDPPREPDEEPFGIGVGNERKLLAYRGRLWETGWGTSPFDEGIEFEIESFSQNDVGSVCYYEKTDDEYRMVLG
jgi:hypothetical protein